MNYALDITGSFRKELFDAVDYIELTLKNPSASDRLYNKTYETISDIQDNPYMYPLYHERTIADLGYRYTSVLNYLIFYIIDDSQRTIHISRFIYGGRDITNIL